MRLTILLSFLLVGATLTSAAATAKPTKKFPKKFDPKLHSIDQKENEQDPSYISYDNIPYGDDMIPPQSFTNELPPHYLQVPLEYLYTNSEGEFMGVMLPPGVPYDGYTSYDPDSERIDFDVPKESSYAIAPVVSIADGVEFTVPEISSYAVDPVSIAYTLSGEDDGGPSRKLEPPTDLVPPNEESSYSTL